MLRKGKDVEERDTLDCNTQIRRNKGRLRITWKRNIEKQALKEGKI
jgi:hypothetical protein